MQPEATRRQISLLRAQERDDAEAGVTRAVPISHAIDQLVASCVFQHTGLSESSSDEDEAHGSRRSSGIGIPTRRLSLVGLPCPAAAHPLPVLSESESDDEAAGVWSILPPNFMTDQPANLPNMKSMHNQLRWRLPLTSKRRQFQVVLVQVLRTIIQQRHFLTLAPLGCSLPHPILLAKPY
jgi:hypothetical protein